MAQFASPGVSVTMMDIHEYSPAKDMSHDGQYLNLIQQALIYGVRKPNRTGVDTISVFGHQMKFNLRDGTIPLLTTKKMFTRGIIHEILWYLKGTENIKYLQDNKVSIWDEWADKDGNLGPVYGVQWRKWPAPYLVESDWPELQLPSGDPYYQIQYIDQIAELVKKLKTNPNDRRMIVSAWNVADIPDMALPPCHYVFQCFARPLTLQERVNLWSKQFPSSTLDVIQSPVADWDQILKDANIPVHELSLMLNQRSCDIGLGVPFNIVQYSILLRMLCEVANMVPGDFIWNGGDVHIYDNHITQLQEQLMRTPFPAPTFRFGRKVSSIDDFKFEDFIIEGYNSHPTIKMDVAV